MGCSYQPNCGGCTFRDLSETEYRTLKAQKIQNLLEKALLSKDYTWETPIFIADGTRRRASLAFRANHGKIVMGFNENKSSEIENCRHCPALTPALNEALPILSVFLEKLCSCVRQEKIKGGKIKTTRLTQGDLLLLEADNGIDIVLEADTELGLDHRHEIFELMNGNDRLIRFSHRRRPNTPCEPVIEKTKPTVRMGNYDIFVAPGTFLQASKEAQNVLSSLVAQYLDDTPGKIADFFCGIGTFTYPLIREDRQIFAYDLSDDLLDGFRQSVHAYMLHAVRISRRNLFKDPPDASELKTFDALIFDPPRAGAQALVRQLAQDGPKKLIAVSCNPNTFINDANTLIGAGYTLRKITLVDQFVYSNHSELVALFTK